MEETNFFPLLLVVLLSFAVPIVVSRFNRLRLPVVVGEIIAGIIVGQSGLDWIPHNDHILELLAEFGFVFLMFLSGMEIDFSNFIPSGKSQQKGSGLRQPVPLGVFSFVLTLLLSTLFSFGLVKIGLIKSPWMMALILSTTSLGVVLPVLKENRLSSGRYGQTLLISALIADFATMLLITVVVAAISQGLTLDLLLVGVLFVAFFFFYRSVSIFTQRVPSIGRIMDELSHATSQIKVRAAFTTMLIFVVLSQALGAEIILGSFLAGAIIALLRTPEDEELIHRLEAIGFGFFIPVFFIMVGVTFNLKALFNSPQSLLLVPLLVGAAIIVKVLPALIYRLTFTWRETFAAGALLSARLSLIIAASAIGVRVGVISESINAAIILVALITVTLAPLSFLRIIPRKAQDEPRWVIVAGASELGLEVGRSLVAHNEKVILVTQDPHRRSRALEMGFNVIAGFEDLTPEEETTLFNYLEKASSLVCTYTNPEKSFQAAKLARGRFGIDNIIVQAVNPADLSRFELLGVRAMNAAVDQANLLVLLARNPSLYQLVTRTDDNKEVIDVIVRNQDIIGKALRELKLPGDALILALQRNGELVVPHGSTTIEEYDRLSLVGSCECIQSARVMFQ